MTRIVGHKIVQYVRVVMSEYGTNCEITHHQIVHELHATKGWRYLRHDTKVHTARKLPSREMWRELTRSVFVWKDKIPIDNAKWSRPAYAEPNLKAQMRHRERRRDIARAANLAALAQP